MRETYVMSLPKGDTFNSSTVEECKKMNKHCIARN